MKEYIFLFIAFTLGWLMMGLSPLFYFSEEIKKPAIVEEIEKELIHDYSFILSDNGYSGWQMGCNYTGGSNVDWDEETQRYGDQKYLDCANGLVYEKIGKSTSITYFNPNDKETNEKYCKKGEVARFSYEDPISGLGDGDFVGCFNF